MKRINEAKRDIDVESSYTQECAPWKNPAAIRLTSIITGLLAVYARYASMKK